MIRYSYTPAVVLLAGASLGACGDSKNAGNEADDRSHVRSSPSPGASQKPLPQPPPAWKVDFETSPRAMAALSFARFAQATQYEGFENGAKQDKSIAGCDGWTAERSHINRSVRSIVVGAVWRCRDAAAFHKQLVSAPGDGVTAHGGDLYAYVSTTDGKTSDARKAFARNIMTKWLPAAPTKGAPALADELRRLGSSQKREARAKLLELARMGEPAFATLAELMTDPRVGLPMRQLAAIFYVEQLLFRPNESARIARTSNNGMAVASAVRNLALLGAQPGAIDEAIARFRDQDKRLASTLREMKAGAAGTQRLSGRPLELLDRVVTAPARQRWQGAAAALVVDYAKLAGVRWALRRIQSFESISVERKAWARTALNRLR